MHSIVSNVMIGEKKETLIFINNYKFYFHKIIEK